MRDDNRVRRNGRPPLDSTQPSPVVSARLSSTDYDALYALARIRRVDMSVLVREAIAHILTVQVAQTS